MMHDLELRSMPVGEHHLIGGDADDASGEMDALAEGFHGADRNPPSQPRVAGASRR
jgi:hypothetical protein